MTPKQVYFDNAATSFPKPPAVVEAMVNHLTLAGVAGGRGGYATSTETARLIHECRIAVNDLIGGVSPDCVVFTSNCTDALNLAIKGLLHAGKPNHVVCTQIDHNSVIRPLYALADLGIAKMTCVPVDSNTLVVNPEDIQDALRSDTRLIVMTQVSNVTGVVQPFRAVGEIARQAGVPFLLDAAQGIGHLLIDIEADYVDLLAAPGHKGLMGPLGTGFLYIRPGLEQSLRPLKEGGTGSAGEDDRHPTMMPDRYEAGSRNAPGIIGLLAGIEWIRRQGIDHLRQRHQSHRELFESLVRENDAVTVHGLGNPAERVGVASITVRGWNPHDLAAVLESNYGILTRAGTHCAPSTHRLLGTATTGGTVRFSFGPFNTEKEIRFAANAVLELAAMGP